MSNCALINVFDLETKNCSKGQFKCWMPTVVMRIGQSWMTACMALLSTGQNAPFRRQMAKIDWPLSSRLSAVNDNKQGLNWMLGRGQWNDTVWTLISDIHFSHLWCIHLQLRCGCSCSSKRHLCRCRCRCRCRCSCSDKTLSCHSFFHAEPGTSSTCFK